MKSSAVKYVYKRQGWRSSSSSMLARISLFWMSPPPCWRPRKMCIRDRAYTCALYKDGKAYTSSERGILPLLKWVLAKAPLQGFSAADKVVGKAAAFLYALMEVDGVYAQVMSEGAYQTLLRHGTQPFYGLRVPGIINRTGDGPCPMEQAVSCLLYTSSWRWEA